MKLKKYNKMKKEKEKNDKSERVKVAVRCRPLNSKEEKKGEFS